MPPEARAVAAVRHTLAAALATWGLREALCDASVVTSELVTNAIRHARPDIELHTALGRGLLLIEVRDASTTPPVMTLSPEALGGMGLPVVHALSRDYGWTPVRQGKCVWALMTVRNYLKTLPNHELDAAGELR
ncbi:ATP-binding protein [Streptomyces kronopolitis]|uniref:ATP-binding protein n=1 Tax=Streptomyces kronopolitis TaxID=1612435 RepID=UPI0036A6B53A